MRRMRQNGFIRQMHKKRTVCDYKNISVRICGTGASVYPSCGQMAEQQNNAKKVQPAEYIRGLFLFGKARNDE